MDQFQKIRKLELKLHALVFLLILFMVGGAFILLPSFRNAALALTGNYNRNATIPAENQLDINSWNLLDDDFLDKSGDTMSGDLNMGGGRIIDVANPTTGTDVANQSYVLSQISSASSIEDISGNTMNMVCGSTDPSAWQRYTDGRTVFVDIDMSAAGFSSTPFVITSLVGSAWHWQTYGATSLYSLTSTGFRVYVYNLGMPMDETNAATWNWSINWCGISN